MKLKCIGGRCDGMIVDIADHPRYREGSAVSVPNYPTSISELEFSPEPTITTDVFTYIIDKLRYAHSSNRNGYNEIWFLRPTNFTTFDAIQYQFRK